MFLAFMLNLIY